MELDLNKIAILHMLDQHSHTGNSNGVLLTLLSPLKMGMDLAKIDTELAALEAAGYVQKNPRNAQYSITQSGLNALNQQPKPLTKAVGMAM